ncbi:cysteine-rich protein 2 [Geospiza fortis]|uniref:Cysteine-rich protein 2 n=1 Tax=Geospiza fortis TaxID=48883 RepID=A0A8N5I1Y4_GEOFO|nr:cysteine-rich protein 2 [Geospiza fortis]
MPGIAAAVMCEELPLPARAAPSGSQPRTPGETVGQERQEGWIPITVSLPKEAALQAVWAQPCSAERDGLLGTASCLAWERQGTSQSAPLVPPGLQRVLGSGSPLSVSPAAEKVSSLGKDWHQCCLKCERCNKTLTPGGHAEHDGKPFCHKPCYATLFGPKGTSLRVPPAWGAGLGAAGGARSPHPIEHPVKVEERKVNAAPPKGPSKASSVTTFTGEPNMCPRCGKRVYFAEKVTSLGKDWHRPCLRCERCSKTLTPGGHAEHDGQPYCHKPCYGILFGPKGVNTGAVGSYIYDKDPEAKNQP